MKDDRILLAHGGGGLLTNQLIERIFFPHLKNPYLERMEDSAVFSLGEARYCFSTDSYVVNPIFFPGGDIGSLAVHGTVNDIAMCGGRPLFLSAGFILEEGFPLEDLDAITRSMAEAASHAGVMIVTGDTKVVARGSADGIFINTAGIGAIDYAGEITARAISPGDAVILSGTIGDHGAAILSAREALGLTIGLVSDSAPLAGLVGDILTASPHIHCMRDATRGGLGAVLAELASQSGCTVTIEEGDIPVREEVRGLCEILGLDPLYLANEGKMVVFCPEGETARVLETMRAHPYGRDAALIGRVDSSSAGRAVMNTLIGGSRIIDLPAGELVPRIC